MDSVLRDDAALREMHQKYFKRMLDGLPAPYQAADLQRLTLVYFCVTSLDLLGLLDETLQAADRAALIEWIYNLQVPPSRAHSPRHCGFKGGTYVGQPFDPGRTNQPAYFSHEHDTGHIAMTYTALTTLTTLGDDLSRIDRAALVSATARLQQPDGSFAGCLDGSECDMRFLFCACAVCYMLNDWTGVDRERALDFIASCATFDGAFSLVVGQEAHGGSTFCAVAALTLLGELDRVLPEGSGARDDLIRWCLQRQVGGFQGRTNKDPDSCYSFWVGGTLELLGVLELADCDSTTAFVEKCEQGRLGGFAKTPGEIPDTLHSFYGLTWFSLVGHRSVRPLRCDLGICADRFQGQEKGPS